MKLSLPPKLSSSSGGAQENGKTGSKQNETLFATKSGAFLSLIPPLEGWLMYLTFLQVFFLNLTRFWTKLRVLVPCFLDFTQSSNILRKRKA